MQTRSLIIKNLCPGLAEVGKIKAGRKGRVITSAKGTQFQAPERLDHFIVTTLFRGPDGNYEIDQDIHQKYGDKPRSLPVRLLFDDIPLNFQCRYACFIGRSLWCSGDGESASRASGSNGHQDVPCPCGRQLPDYTGQDKCKINSKLSVLIDGTERVGGVWSLRSTSWNTTVGILSSLSLIKRITGGPLAGLPLELTLRPKTAITPDGKSTNIWVAGIEFRGSIEKLQQIGLEQAKRDALHHARIERIEEEARLLLAHDPLQFKEEADDVVDEFYPDQAAAEIKGNGKPEAPDPPAPPVATESASQTDAPLPPPVQSEQQQQASTARRRTKKWEVDPNRWDGKTEIQTCGANPDDILRIKEHAKDPDKKRKIVEFMRDVVHYDQLSFLKHEEAVQLLASLEFSAAPSPSPEDPPEESPQDKVFCPREEDTVYRSWCLSECPQRQADGFCPLIEDPPEGDLI